MPIRLLSGTQRPVIELPVLFSFHLITVPNQIQPELLKYCRIHIVVQPANRYIVAFHIAISHDIYWHTRRQQ